MNPRLKAICPLDKEFAKSFTAIRPTWAIDPARKVQAERVVSHFRPSRGLISDNYWPWLRRCQIIHKSVGGCMLPRGGERPRRAASPDQR